MKPPTTSINRRTFLAASATLAGLGMSPLAIGGPQGSRTERLIRLMTLEEKAGQLSCFNDVVRWSLFFINPTANPTDQAQMLTDVRGGRIGVLMNGFGIEGGRTLQRAAVEQSRLKIPLIFAADVIHGYKTIFPVPLGESASFDTDLAERTARAAAREVSAHGVHWNFAPMVDVARDERWGRVVEGAGEDTTLGQAMAVARVKGFQGQNLRADDSLAATAKHFAGYGAVSGGMEYNSVSIGEATLREVHLPPFWSAFDAGCLTTMAAFTEINGVPASANKLLLKTILRDEMRFKGPVISDYAADAELVQHGYAADERDAARMAILSGIDISMQSGLYNKHLPELVRSGAVPMAVVDAAVRRVLLLKEALGLFDNPYRSLDDAAPRQRIGTPEHIALAREAGAKSIVLLKNDGNLLPLSPGSRIALIGPCASGTGNQFGAWAFTGDKESAVDVATGLKAAMAPAGKLSAVAGCGFDAPIAGGIEAAVAAARAADVVILALGESQEMSGESASRAEIGLPAAQVALAQAISALGKPIVVLLRHGRALALPPVVRAAPALLATWFLGSETGNAIADVVFGKVNPSAHLPVSFPMTEGQQPFFYNHAGTGRPDDPNGTRHMFTARYREASNVALFPFGHGLSYTSFKLDNLQLSDREIGQNASIKIRARLSNTGARTGVQVVQLYIRDDVASMVRPVRLLKAFRRVELAAGQDTMVEFSLSRDDLGFVDARGHQRVEAGTFTVWVAEDAAGGLKGTFRLLAS